MLTQDARDLTANLEKPRVSVEVLRIRYTELASKGCEKSALTTMEAARVKVVLEELASFKL